MKIFLKILIVPLIFIGLTGFGLVATTLAKMNPSQTISVDDTFCEGPAFMPYDGGQLEN